MNVFKRGMTNKSMPNPGSTIFLVSLTLAYKGLYSLSVKPLEIYLFI